MRILPLIQDINILWQDVYPYLAHHIIEVYGRLNGRVIEIGPFCGVIHEFVRMGAGDSFCIGSFPVEITEFYKENVRQKEQTDSIAVIDTDPHLKGIDDGSFGLVIFRGALFFPDFFAVDFEALWRVMKPHGMVFAGGGFGKYTPHSIISSIARTSRELNLRIGKNEVSADMIQKELRTKNMLDSARILTDDGLWVIIRKENCI